MKRLLALSTLALALQPLTAVAVPVTLQATFNNFDITYDGIGVFTLSFDDAESPDEYLPPIGDTVRARYDDVITNASFVWDNLSLTLDDSYTSQIIIGTGRYLTTDAAITLRLKDANDAKYDLHVPFEINGAGFPDVSLANLIGLKTHEGSSRLYPVGTSPVTGPYFMLQQSPLAPVPVPAAAWLFASSVAGLAALSRRNKA